MEREKGEEKEEKTAVEAFSKHVSTPDTDTDAHS